MDNLHESKEIDIDLKKDSGQVKAVFSVFNSLDSDGDVVVPGAVKSGFKNDKVPMVWSHNWDKPIGKVQSNKPIMKHYLKVNSLWIPNQVKRHIT